jgi:hypothetical protein
MQQQSNKPKPTNTTTRTSIVDLDLSNQNLIPKSLSITIQTSIPGYQTVKYVPRMTDPNIDKENKTVYFDPLVKLDQSVINKIPEKYRKNEFFDEGLFQSMINFHGLKREITLLQARKEGIIDNNIEITLNNIFPMGSLIYIGNEPYVIADVQWRSGTWKMGVTSIEDMNLEELTKQTQYNVYLNSIQKYLENLKKQLQSLPNDLKYGVNESISLPVAIPVTTQETKTLTSSTSTTTQEPSEITPTPTSGPLVTIPTTPTIPETETRIVPVSPKPSPLPKQPEFGYTCDNVLFKNFLTLFNNNNNILTPELLSFLKRKLRENKNKINFGEIKQCVESYSSFTEEQKNILLGLLNETLQDIKREMRQLLPTKPIEIESEPKIEEIEEEADTNINIQQQVINPMEYINVDYENTSLLRNFFLNIDSKNINDHVYYNIVNLYYKYAMDEDKKIIQQNLNNINPTPNTNNEILLENYNRYLEGLQVNKPESSTIEEQFFEAISTSLNIYNYYNPNSKITFGNVGTETLFTSENVKRIIAYNADYDVLVETHTYYVEKINSKFNKELDKQLKIKKIDYTQLGEPAFENIYMNILNDVYNDAMNNYMGVFLIKKPISVKEVNEVSSPFTLYSKDEFVNYFMNPELLKANVHNLKYLTFLVFKMYVFLVTNNPNQEKQISISEFSSPEYSEFYAYNDYEKSMFLLVTSEDENNDYVELCMFEYMLDSLQYQISIFTSETVEPPFYIFLFLFANDVLNAYEDLLILSQKNICKAPRTIKFNKIDEDEDALQKKMKEVKMLKQYDDYAFNYFDSEFMKCEDFFPEESSYQSSEPDSEPESEPESEPDSEPEPDSDSETKSDFDIEPLFEFKNQKGGITQTNKKIQKNTKKTVKNKLGLTYDITIQMELKPGTSMTESERKELLCNKKWNNIRKDYANLTGMKYVIQPVYQNTQTQEPTKQKIGGKTRHKKEKNMKNKNKTRKQLSHIQNTRRLSWFI